MADAAREPFFTIVLGLVFPPFFVASLVRDPVAGIAWWGYALTVSGLLLVVLAPLAGAIADTSRNLRPWIVASVVLASAALLALWSASEPHESAAPVSQIVLVLLLCVLAQVTIELMRVFTDRLLPIVARPDEIGGLSGLGVGFGFAAGFVYVLGLRLTGDGSTLDSTGTVERIATAGTGLWLAVFMVPLIWLVPWRELRAAQPKLPRIGLVAQLVGMVRQLRSDGEIARFLIARMIYWDGTMALFSFVSILISSTLGWTTAQLSTYGLVCLIAGSSAGLLGGRVDRRFGARNAVLLSLAGMITCTVALAVTAWSADGAAKPLGFDTREGQTFLAFGTLASGFLGLIMSSSRALLVRLAPADRVGEYFGLYVMVGRASSFLAPLLVALGATISGDQLTGVFGVSLALLAAGMALLARVRRC